MQIHTRNTTVIPATMSNHQPTTSHGRVVKPHQENPNQPPPPPPQKCPRCDSANTKFCYYNNYSLSQPRYFCKACRRYWTHGGTLRNIPVGGGCRKGKRPKLSPSTSNAPSTVHHEMSSGTQIPSTPAFSSQSHVTGAHHQASRAMNPLMMSGGNNMPNLYNDSSAGGGGFFSSLGMIQSQPPQGGVASGGYGGQFGGNVALLQGMNYQSLKPQVSQQQMMIPPQQLTQIQPRAPLGSWAQGFINNTGAATNRGSSMAPNTSFWGGANIGGDQGNVNTQAGGSSFNPNNQWKNRNNNQGF